MLVVVVEIKGWIFYIVELRYFKFVEIFFKFGEIVLFEVLDIVGISSKSVGFL